MRDVSFTAAFVQEIRKLHHALELGIVRFFMLHPLSNFFERGSTLATLKVRFLWGIALFSTPAFVGVEKFLESQLIHTLDSRITVEEIGSAFPSGPAPHVTAVIPLALDPLSERRMLVLHPTQQGSTTTVNAVPRKKLQPFQFPRLEEKKGFRSDQKKRKTWSQLNMNISEC